MSIARDLIIDQLPPTVDNAKHLATWYTQGHADSLGDRLLMFDNTSAPSWEILRFRPSLARNEQFEAALRERVERLVAFHHPAFPLVRPIKNLGHDDGLAVVSTYAAGARLSEAMKRPRSATFAVRLIRQLVPALAALQRHGPGIAHGVLDLNRIVVTGGGRLMIREHMVGSAIASLELSAQQLWSDFGILASPSHTTIPVLDCRSDVTQVGLIALSLMIGRRIGPDEYPDRIEALLDDIAERNGRHSLVIFQPLRYWLERALQLDEYMFESAHDANEALSELRDEPDGPEDYLAAFGPTLPDATAPFDDADAIRPGRRGPRLIAPRHSGRTDTADDLPLAAPGVRASLGGLAAAADDAYEMPMPGAGRAAQWMAGVFFAVAMGEAAFIGRMLYARAANPTPPVVGAPQPAVAPPAAAIQPAVVEPTPSDARSTAETVAKSAAPAVPAATLQKNGAFRLSSP